jgi:two-component system, cell cycle response regulator
VQGTILIIDGVATNRIMLKVQLSSAYYRVIQAEGLDGILSLVRRSRPDLIIAAMTLPDGDATAIRSLLAPDESLRAIPIIAVTGQNDRASRLRALASGIDDVLSQPVGDRILQARIRSLISMRNSTDDLRLRDGTSRALGFAEPVSEFVAPAQIALVTREARTGTLWRTELKGHVSHHLRPYRLDELGGLVSRSHAADVIVIEVSEDPDDPGLRLLVDLRSRFNTRHAAIIAVPSTADYHLAADALDRGAHDTMPLGFCAEELSLRLATQLQRKAQSDKLRKTVRDGLRAAVLDPMTGLYNRRYAIPQLSKIALLAEESNKNFAVMLLDLDHFKLINDRFGHPAGDAVLTETAARLQALMRPDDLIARVGGEEFMIVMQNTDTTAAVTAAERVCRTINSKPYHLNGHKTPIDVTTSVGVVVGPTLPFATQHCAREKRTEDLIGQADRALYESKGAGRNQVTLIGSAA